MASFLFYSCLISLLAAYSSAATATSKDCGTSTATATFEYVRLKPDPLNYPGDVLIATKLQLKKALPDDVQIGVRLVKLNPDLDVPCMANFGSCDYPACDMLSKYKQLCTLFPDGKECVCPFAPGQYQSNEIRVAVPNFGPVFGKIIEGDFKGNLTIFSKSAPNTILGCAHVTFSVKSID